MLHYGLRSTRTRQTRPFMAKNWEKYRWQDVRDALIQSNGIKLRAARLIGCHRHTIEEYCKRYKKVAEACDRGMEIRLDEAEIASDDLIADRDGAHTRWWLARMGKHRGYGDALEGAVPGSVTIIMRPADE